MVLHSGDHNKEPLKIQSFSLTGLFVLALFYTAYVGVTPGPSLAQTIVSGVREFFAQGAVMLILLFFILLLRY